MSLGALFTAFRVTEAIEVNLINLMISRISHKVTPCVAHVVNKVFAKVSKKISKVKIEKVWH